MRAKARATGAAGLRHDAAVGNRLIEVRAGAAAVRNVRADLLRLAAALAESPEKHAYLVLADSVLTPKRLRAEWQIVRSAIRPQILKRITLCVEQDGQLVGIPHDADPIARRAILEAIGRARPRIASPSARSDASFVVTKVLLSHWLTGGGPVTSDWLSKTSGYSYPTIAAALRRLGSLVRRRSDRKLELRWFPKEELTRLVAVSVQARSTVRFADRSGSPRSPEAHLRRLQSLGVPNLAIGGVFGARHYLPALDVVGAPRLDLSQHGPRGPLSLDFIAKLDPALDRVTDALEPAHLVVHAVRHADPMFEARREGLHWADPLECLLDLHEARMEAAAEQLLKALLSTSQAPRG